MSPVGTLLLDGVFFGGCFPACILGGRGGGSQVGVGTYVGVEHTRRVFVFVFISWTFVLACGIRRVRARWLIALFFFFFLALLCTALLCSLVLARWCACVPAYHMKAVPYMVYF